MVQLDAAIQGRLAAECQHDAVGALLGYDALHEEGGDGQEIDVVGHTLAGLHRGDVGVDQHGLDSLLAQGLQGLAAGIVKLAGLAYLQRART